MPAQNQDLLHLELAVGSEPSRYYEHHSSREEESVPFERDYNLRDLPDPPAGSSQAPRSPIRKLVRGAGVVGPETTWGHFGVIGGKIERPESHFGRTVSRFQHLWAENRPQLTTAVRTPSPPTPPQNYALHVEMIEDSKNLLLTMGKRHNMRRLALTGEDLNPGDIRNRLGEFYQRAVAIKGDLREVQRTCTPITGESGPRGSSLALEIQSELQFHFDKLQRAYSYIQAVVQSGNLAIPANTWKGITQYLNGLHKELSWYIFSGIRMIPESHLQTFNHPLRIFAVYSPEIRKQKPKLEALWNHILDFLTKAEIDSTNPSSWSNLSESVVIATEFCKMLDVTLKTSKIFEDTEELFEELRVKHNYIQQLIETGPVARRKLRQGQQGSYVHPRGGALHDSFRLGSQMLEYIRRADTRHCFGVTRPHWSGVPPQLIHRDESSIPPEHGILPQTAALLRQHTELWN
ncbi:hypothetical protein TWF730_008464 [Orbilia blumenaviensis]|uniref:Uncharacterized protein n=1 Tax=Orbilia blumenaviensis TaxID=1796055 RepID=A0AAV9V352_9PEZI